jgi:hypothetical protein
MITKAFLQNKQVIVNIAGVEKPIKTTVSFVEEDGFWFISGDIGYGLQLGITAPGDSLPSPAVFVPTSQILWLMTSNE